MLTFKYTGISDNSILEFEIRFLLELKNTVAYKHTKATTSPQIMDLPEGMPHNDSL